MSAPSKPLVEWTPAELVAEASRLMTQSQTSSAHLRYAARLLRAVASIVAGAAAGLEDKSEDARYHGADALGFIDAAEAMRPALGAIDDARQRMSSFPGAAALTVHR